MIFRTTTALVALGATLLLGGCAERIRAHGQFIEPSKMAQLTPGVSTVDDVQAVFGPPTASATFDPNVWYYIGQHVSYKPLSRPKILDREVVVVTFRENQVLDMQDRVVLVGDSDIPLIQRETPSSGKTLGLLEQLLGNLGRFNNNTP